MRISFLSGAYKNAGDYLIEKRAISILKKECEGIVINKYLRSDLKSQYQKINDADAIVIGGGPLYAHDIEGTIPLDICLNKIDIPIMIMGCGWYGAFGSKTLANSYHFSPKTLDFLKKVDIEGLGLSCRDIYSVNALKANGINNAIMTGCPAWYDLTKINSTSLNQSVSNKPKTIVISDPALPINYQNAISVTKHLASKYPTSNIKYVFHRGISLENIKFKNYYYDICSIENVEIHDISGDSNGFEIYDLCDLHIGFRVHAHIYNLSIRNKTILIEEDGRGAGVDEAHGLISIKAYNDLIMSETINKVNRRLIKYIPNISKFVRNTAVNSEIDTYIDILNDTNNQYLTNAFMLQRKYYQCMKTFVRKLNKI